MVGGFHNFSRNRSVSPVSLIRELPTSHSPAANLQESPRFLHVRAQEEPVHLGMLALAMTHTPPGHGPQEPATRPLQTLAPVWVPGSPDLRGWHTGTCSSWAQGCQSPPSRPAELLLAPPAPGGPRRGRHAPTRCWRGNQFPPALPLGECGLWLGMRKMQGTLIKCPVPVTQPLT